MLTFFTTAKSFSGPARVHQFNAIRSWKQLHPDAEVILFGDGEGYNEAAQSLGLIRIPGVLTSPTGCPRIDSMFNLVSQRARHPVRAYLNCDIILTDDVLSAIGRVDFPEYLMVAQRRELSVDHELPFSLEAKELFSAQVSQAGVLQDPSAIDMFLYRGNIWSGLPELVVGRGGYDNFLIYFCRRNRIPVVDATDVVTLVHQIHDYGHLGGGSSEVFLGEDAKANFQKAGVISNLFTIVHADWRLTAKGLVPNRCRGDWNLWARANRSLYGRVTAANSSWRALFVDIIYEFTLRCQPDYANRMLALLKYPVWAVSRIVGRR